MRGSGWIVPALATALWIAAVGWPALALLELIAGQTATTSQTRPLGQLLITSTVWAAGVAIGAALLGWIPGRVLGKSQTQYGFLTMAVLLLAPICLPAYLVFYAWWQSWPPDSALHAWVVEHDHVPMFRRATLALGLLSWSWPIVSWCVAGTVASTPAQQAELNKLDGTGLIRRFIGHLRDDLRGLAIGALLVFLVVFNNTTCFDLAEVFTFANEVRAVEALGANARQLIEVAAPARGMALVGAVAVWLLLAGRSHPPAVRVARSSMSTRTITVVIWTVLVMLPMSLFIRTVAASAHGWSAVAEFARLYWGSLITTLGLALGSGCLAMIVSVGLAALWHDQRRWTRVVGHIQALGWLLMALAPATVIGLAIEAGYNRDSVDQWTYQTPTVLLVGHLACFGFVGAFMGRWMVLRQPRALRDLAQLDNAGTLVGLFQAFGPAIIAACAATAAVVFVLAVGEIPVTAFLNPPMRAGFGPLAVTMLNDMHYQRPQTVMAAALVLMALALLAALIVCLCMRSIRLRVLVAITTALLLQGCDAKHDSSDPRSARPVDPLRTFGSPGLGKTQFNYPRAIDIDTAHGWLYIIDKAARVQRLNLDGEWLGEWQMPEFENGKPTGVSIGPDGRVYIPDTHYHRIMIYDANGNLQRQFGKYGDTPGEFIYPTDVAFGPEGRLYVSEYGGNDRIQVFDRDGNFLFMFGGFGPDSGQFNRPQSLTFNADKTELFITDACNHRIVVTDPQGRVLRMFGSPGREPGQLAYPYGLALLDDGTLMVAEFGNNRVQQFDSQGRSLGVWGRVGRGEGDMQYPWAVAASDGSGGEAFVLDSGNNRVQVMRRP